MSGFMPYFFHNIRFLVLFMIGGFIVLWTGSFVESPTVVEFECMVLKDVILSLSGSGCFFCLPICHHCHLY